tara:strand:- start:7 stop:633 length:627 start_codon:yes stop_codon:yes gene_type:complete
MHKLNIIAFGPASFISTLNELKPFLKFNLFEDKTLSDVKKLNNFDILICHVKSLNDDKITSILNEVDCLKILAGKGNYKVSKLFDDIINLPTTLKEINNIIESRAAKNQFNKNSSIRIKEYYLNKNEKKLTKANESIILTEKEIKLLELFLANKNPISKNKILSKVWQYSNEADTHTVETHIYRLRKKINDKFSDENFILNDKLGYSL